MNILLVDDNIYVLESLIKGIDFKTLGFENVFSAKSSKAAQEILKKIDIHMVLTDIEMPAGSGLQLLKWINDFNLNIVTMFCTSFADFNYAQEAVRLHSFDYYLKPIKFSELTNRLVKATEEVKKRRLISEKVKYGQYWLDNLWNNKVDFWIKLLYRIQELNEQELEEEIHKRKLNYLLDDSFVVCIVKLGIDRSKLQYLSGSMQEFVLKNIAEELFAEENIKVEAIFKTAKNVLALILKKGSPKDKEAVTECFRKLLDNINKYMVNYSNFYYYDNVDLYQTKQAVRKLEDILMDDVTGKDCIFEYHDYQKSNITYQIEDMKKWESLLQQKKKEEVLNLICQFVDEKSRRKQLNKQYMRDIRVNMLQMTNTFLKEKQIEANKLFSEDQFDELFEKSLKSVENMKSYLSYLVNTSIDYINFIEQSQTVVDKVAQYIDLHYDTNITRNELGETVYININYLAKIFKQETGKSLHGYLMEKRMDKAKEMLIITELSVSEVSSAVGYDNFSYFSRLFKDKTGYTPKDYRKEFQSNHKPEIS